MGDLDSSYQLGVTCFQQGRFQQAEAIFLDLIQSEPFFGEVYNNLGSLYYLRGDYLAAKEYYQKSLGLLGNSPLLWRNLGLTCFHLKEYPEALAIFEKLNITEQQSLDFEMGMAQASIGNHLAGKTHLQRYLSQNRGQFQLEARACLWLFQISLLYNQVGEAREWLDNASQRVPSAWFGWAKAILLQPVYSSLAEQLSCIDLCLQALEVLSKKNLAAHYSEHLLFSASQWILFQPHSQYDLQMANAEVQAKILQEIAFKEDIPRRVLAPKEPLRIGVISAHFAQPKFQRLWFGLFQALGQAKDFELIFGYIQDPMLTPETNTLEKLKTWGQVWVVDDFLETAQEEILDFALDILIYTDLHLEAMSTRLAFSRLAPIQVLLPGYPLTSGIKTIDYFISSSRFECEQAEKNYSEILVKIEEIGCAYPTLEIRHIEPPGLKDSFQGKATLYLCPAPFMALCPVWDPLFFEILVGDPLAQLLFFNSQIEFGQREGLIQRLKKILDQEIQRVHFYSLTDEQELWTYCSEADLLLDPPGASDLDRAYMALALGIPMLTTWGKTLNGRWAAGLYQSLGLDELIVAPENYAIRAYALAHKEKLMIRQKILSLAPSAFNLKNAPEAYLSLFRSWRA